MVSIDLEWNRETKGFDKIILTGIVNEKSKDGGGNEVVYKKPYMTIQQNGNKLTITYVAKGRKEENNLRKIILNSIRAVRKCGYELDKLILKYLELVYCNEGYIDIFMVAIKLHELGKKLDPFQYYDGKNRYQPNGNIETFVQNKMIEGIKNYNAPFDDHVTIHGYYNRMEEARLELQIAGINCSVFEKKEIMKGKNGGSCR